MVRSKECTAQAVTNIPTAGGAVVVYKGPDESKHAHRPNREKCKAEVAVAGIKRKSAEYPELRPAQILRDELAGILPEVLSHLPEREALKKEIQHPRCVDLPPNLKSLLELDDFPEKYKKTSLGETFLLYDSKNSELEGRVLVFATRRNIQFLGQSCIWFLDGTFMVSPSIFA